MYYVLGENEEKIELEVQRKSCGGRKKRVGFRVEFLIW